MDIFTAAEKGELGTITELLAADPGLVKQHREDGWTALHLAAFYGQPAAVELLLARGADVARRSTNYMENTPLHAAVAGRHAAVVAVLLANAIDVNASQSGGWTPLQGAAHNGDAKIVEMLLASGADPDAPSDNGETALSLATGKNYTEVIQLLSPK
jgi:ankyrin repeat protein